MPTGRERAADSLNRGDDWSDSPAPMGFVRGTPTWGKADTCNPALFLCPGTGQPAVCAAPASNAAVAQ